MGPSRAAEVVVFVELPPTRMAFSGSADLRVRSIAGQLYFFDLYVLPVIFVSSILLSVSTSSSSPSVLCITSFCNWGRRIYYDDDSWEIDAVLYFLILESGIVLSGILGKAAVCAAELVVEPIVILSELIF